MSGLKPVHKYEPSHVATRFINDLQTSWYKVAEEFQALEFRVRAREMDTLPNEILLKIFKFALKKRMYSTHENPNRRRDLTF